MGTPFAGASSVVYARCSEVMVFLLDHEYTSICQTPESRALANLRIFYAALTLVGSDFMLRNREFYAGYLLWDASSREKGTNYVSQ